MPMGWKLILIIIAPLYAVLIVMRKTRCKRYQFAFYCSNWIVGASDLTAQNYSVA